MTTDRVFIPPRISETNIKATGEQKPDHIKQLEEEAESAKLYRRIREERKLSDQLDNPGEPPEPPVKVTGEISMGKVDLQAQAKEAREAEAAARRDAETRVDKLREDLDKAREETNNAKLENVKLELGTKINLLVDALNKNQQGQPSFESMLTQAETMAEKLGYTKGPVSNGDFEGQMSLLRLQAEINRDNQRFQLEMERGNREWQLKLEQIRKENLQKEEELRLGQQKINMIASIPQQLGAAFANGMLARGQSQGISSAAGPPPAPVAQSKHRILEAYHGETGRFICDGCKTEVGIVPSTTQVQCAGCGTIFDVRRINPPEVEGVSGSSTEEQWDPNL